MSNHLVEHDTLGVLGELVEAEPVTSAELARLEARFLIRVTGWVLWPPKKWVPGIPVAVAAFWPPSLGPVPVLVCPECGEAAAACNPKGWTVALGPFPQWAHAVDGEPLCPVMTSTGYRPAPRPIPVTWFGSDARTALPEILSGGETP
jgi:hypothetical protein